jgi:hypothetical protein
MSGNGKMAAGACAAEHAHKEEDASLSAVHTHTSLRRLCDDISLLDADVHSDIVKHIEPGLLTHNGNGVFFDMTCVDSATIEGIRGVVEYAKGMRNRLAEHDREIYESSQRLVSGPVDTACDEQRSGHAGQGELACASVRQGEGEEAFVVRMESGCVSKPAKGVFLKK